MIQETLLLLCLAAFAAGFIDSIAGGGGLLLTPSLLLAGVPPHVALGTNKFASTLGTSTALYNFVQSKMVLWKVAAFGIAFSLVGSYGGTMAVLSFPAEPLGRLILLVLPFAGMAALMPKKERHHATEFSQIDLMVKAPLICFAIGFYDGFLGPGTGSFLILAFHAFLKIDLVRASATAKIFNFSSNLAALAVFAADGKVDYWLGLPLAAANIAGNWLGSHLAIRKGAGLVRWLLIASLSILFLSLAWKFFLA
ncbi:conserved membrane hypothetical protein [Rhodospirillaceae bacterium LM-1]|nr:conserved membrane hypothetical protein [Rhodospirillaceae bacterium LM-1]